MKTVNVLVIKDHIDEHGNSMWSAQCLEHDIAAQGDSVKAAMIALTKAIVCEDANMKRLGGTIEDIPKAPEDCWAMFRNAAKLDAEAMKPSVPGDFSVKSENSLPPAHMIPRFEEARVA